MEYKTIKDKQALRVDSRAEWREWLAANHAKFELIWLIYYKTHTGLPSLSKADANKEALCFGWVDSLIMGIDDECYMQKFTPRKADSIWSELNKKRVKELASQGLIHPAGQLLIDHARASGEWDKDRSTPVHVKTPQAFTHLLQENEKAKIFWEGLTDSQRKQYLLWMTLAKRAETRTRRMEKTIKMLTSKQLPSML